MRDREENDDESNAKFTFKALMMISKNSMHVIVARSIDAHARSPQEKLFSTRYWKTSNAVSTPRLFLRTFGILVILRVKLDTSVNSDSESKGCQRVHHDRE